MNDKRLPLTPDEITELVDLDPNTTLQMESWYAVRTAEYDGKFGLCCVRAPDPLTAYAIVLGVKTPVDHGHGGTGVNYWYAKKEDTH